MVEVRTDRDSAEVNLDLICEHPISCDGLTIWMERLSREEQKGLEERMGRGLSPRRAIANVSAPDVRGKPLKEANDVS